MQNTIAIIVVGALLVPGLWWVVHTRLATSVDDVDVARDDLDRELRHRHDVVARVADRVRSSPVHDRDAVDDLVGRLERARRRSGRPADALADDDALVDAAHVVLDRWVVDTEVDHVACAELRRELDTADERVATAVRFHDAKADALNRRIASFPSSLVARFDGVEPVDYVEA